MPCYDLLLHKDLAVELSHSYCLHNPKVPHPNYLLVITEPLLDKSRHISVTASQCCLPLSSGMQTCMMEYVTPE